MAQVLEYKDLFSTPIWTVNLEPEVAAGLNAHLIAEIDALARPLPPLSAGANWQTAPILQMLPQFADLTRMIERHAKVIAGFLQLKATNMSVSGCWANINPPGGRNSPHSHPNNFLSGTYYVSLPDEKGTSPSRTPDAGADISVLARPFRAGQPHETGPHQHRLQSDVSRLCGACEPGRRGLLLTA